MIRRSIVTLAVAALVSLGIVTATQVSASAHTHSVSSDCQALHVALSNYQQGQASPDQWWNWSPNKDQAPFDGPPSFPTDDRGTWEGPHNNGGPDQDTYGTFNSSNGENGRASWFHREHGAAAGTNHVTVVIDGVAVTDQDFVSSFNQDYSWADDADHTYTVTVTAWDDPTGDKGYTFTTSGSQSACVVKDASAAVSVTAPTCDTGAVLVYGDIANAMFSGTADGTEGPGSYDVIATADEGHEFSDGTTSMEFTGDLAGPDASLCAPPETPKDATASVGVVGPSCDTPGSASVTGVEHASLVGTLSESVGDHVATFTADEGHAFADGSTSLDVPYTIAAQLTGDECSTPNPPNPPHNNPPHRFANPNQPPVVIDAGL